ncbi:hypothetical protein REPUB_Repub18cG0018400 [Reevesia pubescens]
MMMLRTLFLKVLFGTNNEQNTVFEFLVSDDGVPSVSVYDSNRDDLPKVRAKDTVSEAVVVDSSAEQNDGIPVSVSHSNGDGLLADSVEDPVSDVSQPEQNNSSNRVGVEADCHGPVSNGNGDRPEQNGFSDMPETVYPDIASGNESVNDGEILITTDVVPMDGGLDLEHNSERDLSSEVDANLEKETGSDNIFDECGEALKDVHTGWHFRDSCD